MSTGKKEYLVEFSNDFGMVYLNQRDPQTDFWEEIENWEVDVSPEDFAFGIYESLLKQGHDIEYYNMDIEDFEEPEYSDEDTEID